MATETHTSSFRIIAAGFMGAIALGTLLLLMPAASRMPGSAPMLDCLFTATSAVCVTGLVIKDTGTFWSPWGQAVILALIQLGGMGVLTVALALYRATGRDLELRQRSALQDAVSSPRVGGVVRLASFIVKVTLLFELAGAFLLYFTFVGVVGPGEAVWYAVFHSVSAFCNAGFDLMGGLSGEYSSLTSFVGFPLLNFTISALIVMGGLGFLTWDDIRSNGLSWDKYSLQTKVILTYTLALLVLPTLYFFFFEMQSLSAPVRFLASMFQSVTVRTAGFNTVDFSSLSDCGIGMMIVLMLIGGSPGSTAGGMKTTTFAVLLVSALAVYRRRHDLNLFKRRLSDETVRQSLAIFTVYFVTFFAAALAISKIEGLPLLPCMFETSSAVATVGLTMGYTPALSWGSKLILIALMFLGRVGGLTVIYAAVKYDASASGRFPQGKLTVG